MPFDVQQTLAALRLEQVLQVSIALRSSRSALCDGRRVELSMEGSSITFGGPNGEKVLSVIAATTPASRVRSIGRRMAFCIVPSVDDAIENSRL
jgi:hypothetical protein